MCAYKAKKDNRKDSKVPNLYDYPIHKRLADYKKYPQDVLHAVKSSFNLEISLDSLVKLQKALEEDPTPFELKVINSYWSCGKGHYNRKISEIQICSENPHVQKALELYNDLRAFNNKTDKPRTLKDVSEMGFVSERKNGIQGVFNTYGTAQMQCDGYDSGIKSYYYLTLNTIWSTNGIIATNRSILNTISAGATPLGAIYKEFNGNRFQDRLDFSKYIDSLEIPCYECPSKEDDNTRKAITKVSMLGYARKKDINSAIFANNERIVLVKPRFNGGSVKDFYALSSDGLNGYASRLICCNDGIINSLIDCVEGFDINMKDIPLGDNSLEDFLLSPNMDYVIVFAKNKHLSLLKDLLKSKGYDSYPIGRVSQNKYYRLINEDVELMRLPCDITKYHIHDYSIFRIVDTYSDNYVPLYKNFEYEKIDDYFRKNLALGRFYSNKVLIGVSSAKTISMPLVGCKQLTPMQVLPLKPSLEGFDDECVLMTSNVNVNVGKSDFEITINAVVSALMKLVVQGVPLCDAAISTNLLYDVAGNRFVRGAALAKSLACLYAQHMLSVSTMGSSIELMHDLNSKGIVADITAIGTTSIDNFINNSFKKGDKLYLFNIPRDEYNIPDFKYVLKLASQINMNINVGNISAGRVIEFNIADAIIKGTAGDNLGFSFAKVDETTFSKKTGDIILAVNDEWDVDTFNGVYLGVVDDTSIIKGADVEISQEEVERIISRYPFENNPYLRLPKVEPNPQPVDKYLSNKLIINALILHNDDTSEKVFAKLLNDLSFKVSSVKIPDTGNITQGFAVKLREQIVHTDLLICSGKSFENSTHDGFYNSLHHPIVLDALNEHLFSHNGLILGTGEGSRALLELGYLACGNAEMGKPVNLELTNNLSNETSAKIPRVIVVNNHSPFLKDFDMNYKYLTASAGAKLKFTCTDEVRRVLAGRGQIAMQFVDYLGYPTIIYPDNPYGSQRAVAGMTSPDGKILGLFVQPELTINIRGEKSLLEQILISAKEYFL